MRSFSIILSVVVLGCGVPSESELASEDGLQSVPDAGTGGSGGGIGGGGSGGGGSGGGGSGGGVSPTTACQGPQPTSPACLYNVPYECVNGHWQCGFTPLVLAFDREPVRFTSGKGHFNLTGSGEPTPTDWPTARTPWLALDRNHNGVIDDATELFGSAVRLASGERARNGFEVLAELDDNRDGQIDALDRRFADLVVWTDRDSDRATGAGELRNATEGTRALISISLEYRVAPVCDRRGNCGVERAVFTWADALGRLHRGEVVDVHLALQN